MKKWSLFGEEQIEYTFNISKSQSFFGDLYH